MAKTIIVGVDGSETATRAARRAAELADALGSDLHVLTAYGKFEVEKISTGSEEFVFSTEADAEGVAGASLLQLRKDFPTVKLTSAASEGKPGDALVRAAERLDSEIIVVGNKRVQGLARVLGSIARDVASRAPCDVYVVHTHQR